MSRRGPNNWVKSPKAPSYKSKLKAASVALARAQRVQTMRNPRVFAGAYRRSVLGEKKYLDTTVMNGTTIGSDMAAAVAVLSLNIVPQGNTVNSRIGKKLRCMRLQLKGRMVQGAGAVSYGSQVRLAVVWDREPDKAALVPVAGSDIYLSTDAASLTNRDNAPRFRILKEEMFTFPENQVALGAGAAADDSIQHFEWFMNFSRKDLEVIWTKADTTGAVAAMIKGDLLFVIQCSQTIANADLVGYANARLDYEDETSSK